MQKIRRSPLLSAVLTTLPLALLPSAAAQTCVQPGSGLVSWWRFEGNADDFHNDGDVSGGQFLCAHVGRGYESGGGGFISVAHDASLMLALSVPLDGSASSDPDSNPLTFAWAQLAGTPVTLIDASPHPCGLNRQDVWGPGHPLICSRRATGFRYQRR
jgi:hypothetical protein